MSIKSDQYGPEYILEVNDPSIGMKGFLVIDNTALGPSKGGIRMTPDVTVEEVFRLARTMTWKNALAELPFGGAKAGIITPERTVPERKKALIQSFARAIKTLVPKKYIAGPDVNTSETEMQWFVEATGNWRSATGKPAKLCVLTFHSQSSPNGAHEGWRTKKCGLPHEFGSTGFGVANATKVAAELIGLKLDGATVAIHGFGNVGTFAYRILTRLGAKIIAIADKSGAVVSESGFNSNTMRKLISEKLSIVQYSNGKKISDRDFWRLPVDIFIPASVTDVINETNKNEIKAKLIVEGGNIPMQESIEQELFDRGIMFVPDFVANAGGVISSYAEYRGYNPKRMFDTVARKITKTTRTVISKSLRQRKNPRIIALEIATKRIEKRMKRRGWQPKLPHNPA